MEGPPSDRDKQVIDTRNTPKLFRVSPEFKNSVPERTLLSLIGTAWKLHPAGKGCWNEQQIRDKASHSSRAEGVAADEQPEESTMIKSVSQRHHCQGPDAGDTGEVGPTGALCTLGNCTEFIIIWNKGSPRGGGNDLASKVPVSSDNTQELSDSGSCRWYCTEKERRSLELTAQLA